MPSPSAQKRIVATEDVSALLVVAEDTALGSTPVPGGDVVGGSK